jgi:predicted RNA-binding Zn-ribbon protein involved in translation (DUF1610 family)
MVQAPSKADNRAGFVIGASCPGCGGEVELKQDFFVTECRHCGSALRLVMSPIPAAFFAKPRIAATQARASLDRHLRENQFPLTRSSCQIEAILFPYWKLDLIAVKVRTVVEEFTHGEYVHGSYQEETTSQSRRTVALTPISVTAAAGCVDQCFPATIGLRADYLKLHPFDPGLIPDSFTVEPVRTEVSAAMDRAKSSVRTLDAVAGIAGADQHRTEMVGVRASIVYVPFFVVSDLSSTPNAYVVDAVSGRVVSSGAAPADADTESGRTQPTGQIGLELHRCCSCGEDLPSRPSLLYFCRNCGRTTLLGDAAGAMIRCTPHTEQDLLVPFWKIGNQVIPAFRAGNAEAIFRLTMRAGGAAGRLNFDGSIGPDSRVSPANVTRQEAQATGAIAEFRNELDRNPKAIFSAPEPDDSAGELLLIAFHERDYFWVDSILEAISFERALLK